MTPGSADRNAAINLYSDTQTRPSAAMRRAMAEAEVGDEQHGDDPTVNALNARVAELLGYRSAAAFSRAFRRWHGQSPRAARGPREPAT